MQRALSLTGQGRQALQYSEFAEGGERPGGWGRAKVRILERSAGQIEIPGRGYKPISDIRRRHIGSLISTMTTNNDQEEKSRRRWPNQGTDREKDQRRGRTNLRPAGVGICWGGGGLGDEDDGRSYRKKSRPEARKFPRPRGKSRAGARCPDAQQNTRARMRAWTGGMPSP